MNGKEEDVKPEKENLQQRALQEEYLKAVEKIEEGQLLKGKVIEITPEFVFVDVGYKSEGKIPVGEFKELPQLRDTVDVLLLYKEGRNGQVVVSKRRADEILLWKKISHAYRERLPIEAKVVRSIKGGFEALVEGSISAFVPASKIDVERVTDESKYLGLVTQFYVEQYHGGSKRSLVLSRRSLLEDEHSHRREDFFANAKIGDVIEGTVKNITAFGAFIDLGGFDGLLHLNDMSWGRVNRPKDFVQKGDKVRVMIKGIDHENRKINLSLKDLTENPWHSFDQRYRVGDVISGKVLRLTDFGAFVELESGIEGLVHVSELSWVKRIRHPKEVFKIGDTIQVKILGYDMEKEKVSLSFKHVLANPWDDLDQRYPVKSIIKRSVKNLSNTGAFFEIEEGIDGFLHADDISWTKKIKSPEEVLKVGDEIDVMIMGINKEERRVRLGIKQLGDDPWSALEATFKPGDLIEASVVEIKDAGMAVKVQGDIECFIPRRNLFDPAAENFEEVAAKYKAGSTIKAIVEEVSAKKKRLSLSLREYERRAHSEEMGKYLHNEELPEEKATLADFIKEKDKEPKE
ncbi:MAG: 30S ribosomal protein S1 [Spirochaetales bacterium]|nr:30S ribosomal protein S1 [Spirochaetales bacterium]